MPSSTGKPDPYDPFFSAPKNFSIKGHIESTLKESSRTHALHLPIHTVLNSFNWVAAKNFQVGNLSSLLFANYNELPGIIFDNVIWESISFWPSCNAISSSHPHLSSGVWELPTVTSPMSLSDITLTPPTPPSKRPLRKATHALRLFHPQNTSQAHHDKRVMKIIF
jgi:hypothetical protein